MKWLKDITNYRAEVSAKITWIIFSMFIGVMILVCVLVKLGVRG